MTGGVVRHWRSLKVRLLAFAGLGAVAAVVVLGISLVMLFDRYAVRRAGFELRNYLVQLEGALNADASGIEVLGGPPNPRFTVLASGLYWQVIDLAGGASARSLSLAKRDLPRPPQPVTAAPEVFSAALADGTAALVLARGLELNDSGEPRRLLILIAMDRREMDSLSADFAADMSPGLALLAGLIIAAAWLQVTLGLGPLGRLREEIRRVRAGGQSRLAADLPIEVEPLADELNSLLDARDAQVAREKHRAADLAHGLKTPLTALAADAARVRALGHEALAQDIEVVARQMRQVVERELAQARLWSQAGAVPQTEVAPLALSVVRTLERTPHAEGKAIEVRVGAALTVAMPPDDLLEVIGNLLENAVRAAARRVVLHGEAGADGVVLVVADDGPGVPAAQIPLLTQRGQQIGATAGTAGIGLTLVAETLERYGATINFGVSDLGGLRVAITLPVAAKVIRPA